MVQRNENKGTYITLRGEINETCDLNRVFRQDGDLYLDLEGIERINSIGLRNVIDPCARPTRREDRRRAC